MDYLVTRMHRTTDTLLLYHARRQKQQCTTQIKDKQASTCTPNCYSQLYVSRYVSTQVHIKCVTSLYFENRWSTLVDVGSAISLEARYMFTAFLCPKQNNGWSQFSTVQFNASTMRMVPVLWMLLLLWEQTLYRSLVLINNAKPRSNTRHDFYVETSHGSYIKRIGLISHLSINELIPGILLHLS